MNLKSTNRPTRSGLVIGIISLLLGSGILAWSFMQPPEPEPTETDLLAALNPTESIENGIAEAVDEGLLCEVISAKPAIVTLTNDTPDHYRLNIELRGNATTEEVGLVLSTGDRLVRLVIRNHAGGLDAVQLLALDSPANPTVVNQTIFLGNDESHLIEIECQFQAETSQATISATVDGESYVQWNGNVQDLSIRADHAIDERSLALTFQGLRSQLLISKAQLVRLP